METPMIIDAHCHLWLRQDTEWDGKAIRTTRNGQSEFLGEVRQMLPPFMIDGCNSAEVLLANMNYAQVGGAVVVQEYIDGNQNTYLIDVQRRYPERLLCCALADVRKPGYVEHTQHAIDQGFKAIALPGHRIILSDRRIYLTDPEMMRMFKLMEKNGIILSLALADGTTQIAEAEELIAECPDLKIAIAHFGMVTQPDWLEQIKLARHRNVMIESGGITWLFNSEFYPFKGAVRAIREAIDLVGDDKLMWGSDYPRTIVAITYRMSYDFVLKSDLLSDVEKRKFLGENAHRFYGFGPLPHLPYIKNMSE